MKPSIRKSFGRWKIVVLVAIVAMTLWVVPQPTSAIAPQPIITEETNLTSSTTNKLPSVAMANGRVSIAWTAGNMANYAEGAATGGGFTSTTLGSIAGNSTYFNASTAVGTNGVVHYVWIEDGAQLKYRSKAPNQGWSNPKVIAQGQDFANSAGLAVHGDAVFAVWRLRAGALAYATSANGGMSWTSGTLSSTVLSYAGVPKIAIGPDGSTFVTWGARGGNIYFAQWNGSSFAVSAVTSGANDYYFSSVAVAPSGQVFLAWRSITRGIYYAARQSNGSWSPTLVAAQQNVAGSTDIEVDALGNIHLGWTSSNTGQSQAYYVIKTPNDSFSDPIIVSHEGTGFRANIDLAVDIVSGMPTAYIAWESFTNGQYIRYARVTTNSGTTPVPPTPAPPVEAPPPPYSGQYASALFQHIWERTDLPITANMLQQPRSWVWGPQPITGAQQEAYSDSPGGSRLVQYFDKSRMELNNPTNATVTNGLLVEEMINGQVQIGNQNFRPSTPAEQAVAGDPIESNAAAPTYTSFRTVAFPANQAHAPNLVGQVAIAVLARDGSVSYGGNYGRYHVVLGSYDPTLGHNVPDIFNSFFTQHGIVYEGGYHTGQVIDPLFVVGLPLSEPYWAQVNVGGTPKDVLMQAFERRVVTYTPSNPLGFQVEMGNVGQHYLRWRYGIQLH